MAGFILDYLQVQALWRILHNNRPSTVLLPPDGVLSFTHRLVVQLVRNCLTKYQQGHLTSEYVTDLLQNIRTLVQQAEERSQYGDLAFIKQLADEVLSVLERPARSLERLETAEGEAKDGQHLIPGPCSDLIPDTTVLADPDSRICEIPEIQESVGSVIKSLTPTRKPHESDYETTKLIGSGHFGAIYLVHHKDSHQIFALKKMTKRNIDTPKKVKRAYLERDILTFTDCPFVVSMLCSFPTKSHLCMVMEYVGGGDCETLINTMGPLSVPLARLYFAEAVLAVEYLHSYGVVHRDLKPENLLITSSGHIKVTDFGLSKVGIMIPKTNIYKELAEDITREFMDHEMCGTPYYFAPEIILKEGYGRPVDWWSMGIILYEFLVGFLPFDGDSLTELYESVTNGGIIWDCDFAPPPDAQNLITELLRKKPADRLGTGGAFEIKGHPFLSDLDFGNLLSQKPEYIPQFATDVDTSLFINRQDIEEHLASEDEEGDTNEDNKSFEFQNFTSSSERLSKLCTITTRTMNDEDPKSPPQCTPASSTNISEIQKEPFCEPDRDDPISSLPFSSSLSETPAEEEVKSAINLSIKEENSENVKKGKKRRGSIFRRILSSCRRGLSRAARLFACCHSCPSVI
ncbi:microtubule-associated serine/threonine-protein kinase 4-like [Ranitomeya variabilis]|uniref:microtubule-associated serine/threonine-protein kinase 4-like n=1 Tax=Ranitomeya variabilis TaxID=490064 RepID=UPI004057BB65